MLWQLLFLKDYYLMIKKYVKIGQNLLKMENKISQSKKYYSIDQDYKFLNNLFVMMI